MEVGEVIYQGWLETTTAIRGYLNDKVDVCSNSRNLIKTSQVPLRPPINILTAPEKARGDSHSESLYSAVQPTSSRFSHSLSLSLSFTFFFILPLKQVFLPLFFSNPGIHVPQAFVTYMSLEFNSEITFSPQ